MKFFENYFYTIGFLTVLLVLFLTPLFTADAAVLRTPPNNLGLVGYWSMEDGAGSTATDFSGSGNDGTLTNMDPATDWVSGKRGTALDFDGSDDRVNFNTINLPKEGAVIAWWMNPSRDSGIFNQGEGCCDSLIELENNGTEINSETTVNQNLFDFNGIPDARGEWKHYAILFDSSKAYLYINGSKWGEASNYGQDSNGDATNQLEAGFNVNNIGIKTYEPYFDGRIDEVRLYNRALSDTEIQDLYQSGYSQVNSSRELEDIDGLVGWWAMDGKHIDWGAGSDEVKDASGNNNDGTLNGGMSNNLSAAKGRLGQAVKLNGSDEYIELGSSYEYGLSEFSLTAWIYRRNDSDYHGIIVNDNSNRNYWFGGWSNKDCIHFRTDPGNQGPGCISGSVPTNQWVHVAGVHTGDDGIMKIFVDGELSATSSFSGAVDTSSGPVAVGAEGGGGSYYFDGKIDDARIYNQALSANEIDRIYNATRPSGVNTSQTDKLTDGLVGFWSFDGQDVDLSDSSAEVKDVSGNGNHGDAKNGASPTIGRLGQGYAFNGGDDEIQLPSISEGFNNGLTFSAWAKWDDLSASWERIIELGQSANDDNIWFGQESGGNELAFEILVGSNKYRLSVDGNSINVGEWAHYVATVDSSGNAAIYENGNQVASGDLAAPADVARDGNFIGESNWDDPNFDGKIDNVRIYDRALSASEVDKLYQLGN